MIIEISDDSSMVKWKMNDNEDWKSDEISDLIKAYERQQGEWGKWIIAEIQCPNCFEYFETDCYSTGELNKCPNCGADLKGGTEE